MGLKEAKRYINQLHRLQADPLSWPDYLTGLPGRKASLQMLRETLPKLGAWAVAYVRVANIYPYLFKYGPERHVELIEWAAAILKTEAQRYRGSFVGTMGTHDFLLLAKSRHIGQLLSSAAELFGRRTKSFYSPQDRRAGVLLSFQYQGAPMRVGLMQLIWALRAERTGLNEVELLEQLRSSLAATERSLFVLK
jgi:GGDEF domain-containing protein